MLHRTAKPNRRRVLVCLLVLGLLLGLCACGREKEAGSRDSVSIWYRTGDPLAEELTALVHGYNRRLSPELLPVTLRVFPDEESLAAAFETARPDLLLCDHTRAMDLSARGLLRDMKGPLAGRVPAYPASLGEGFDGLGRSFFPLGIQVDLLYYRSDALPEGARDHWESLMGWAAAYGREQRLPAFTAESFGDLFYLGLFARGEEFHALRERALRGDAYRDFYNLVAESAYQGGLAVSRYAAADLVQSGYLPCALVRSGSLRGASFQGFALSPAPETGETCPGECCGLAAMAREGRSTRSAAAFLQWLLEEGRMNALALDSGLVPPVAASPSRGGPLAELLTELSRTAVFHLPEGDGDYAKNRDAFEAAFRRDMGQFRNAD